MTDSHPSSQEEIFRELDQYAWNTDVEFQSGLEAILGQDPQPEQKQHLTLRAQCFYYSR